MMNFFFLTLTALFLYVPAVLPQTEAGSYPKAKATKADDEYIAWATTKRLSWDDFLCQPKQNTDAVASTSTALGVAYQIKGGKLSYQVTCKFSKQKSWGLVKTPYILAHEQGHFDITEIFARKLHQELSTYRFNRTTFQHDLNAIYESIVKAKEAFQAAYDAETDHSRKKQKQAEWLQRIDGLLQDTEPFAAYP